MNYSRLFFLGIFVANISACSLPGLRYQDGGSAVWKGQEGEVGYAADETIQIKEITPGLTLDMAQKATKAGQGVNASGRPQPWVYRVGIGDVLSVIVWDHPELTNPAGTTQSVDSSGRVVSPDGTMFYPYAGNIEVAGKTPKEIRQMLTQALSRAIQSPQVDVKVLQYRSQFVNVVGDIDQPCKLPITDTPLTVIDAMNACRSIRTSATVNGIDDSGAYSHRDIELDRGGQRRSVDLYAIYKGDDPLLREPLVGGDTLYVQDGRRNRVFVVGEVTKQAALYIPVSGLSLADALSSKDVGGLNQETADTKNIYVFRGGVSQAEMEQGRFDKSTFRPQVFHLNAKSVDALLLADQFKLEPRDIVFASSSSLVSYSRVANLILPSLSTLVQTGLFARSVR